MNVLHRLLSSSTDMPWLVSGLQVGSYCVIDDSDDLMKTLVQLKLILFTAHHTV